MPSRIEPTPSSVPAGHQNGSHWRIGTPSTVTSAGAPVSATSRLTEVTAAKSAATISISGERGAAATRALATLAP